VETLFCDRLQEMGTASVTVLAGSHGSEATLPLAKLVRHALCLSQRFKCLGVRPGDRVALLMPTSLEIITSILAAWFAGATFSCLPWTPDNAGSDIAVRRLREMLNVLKPKVVAITDASSILAMRLVEATPELVRLDGDIEEAIGDLVLPRFAPKEIAFIQFTSGSTRESPKGVVVRHEQLRDNIVGIGEKICVDDHDIMVSWAPLHHDMGLVSLLLSLYYGLSVVLIPSETFGRRPALWLEALHRFRGTLSPAPPSAFHLLTKRSALRGRTLDLSSWRYAWVGAEPIFPAHLAAFESMYSNVGLQEGVLQGTYGLAEAVVIVSNGHAGCPRLEQTFDGPKLRENGIAVVCDASTPGALALVGCGTPNRNIELKIADEEGFNQVEDGRKGHILIRGLSVTEGYFGENRVRQVDEWLDTGDLGFLYIGQLFILGRTKDLVKRGGVGFAPQDIEWVIERILGLKTGRAAAFSHLCHERNKEEIVVLVEEKISRQDDTKLMHELVSAVALEVGVQIDRLHFIGLNAIPRTSSGKLKRNHARELYVNGAFAHEPS
jgi:fatty-acyl-CoA synthase